MIAEVIEKATRVLGAPQGQTVQDVGQVFALAVRDVVSSETGTPHVVSAWRPTPEELEALQNGATIKLWVVGENMPPVALTVGEIE